ncbi:MAG: fibro-slime domain-containing protein, partial [Ruminococcaceae bacterium]|nr:fibro-slime domain-containing protein [Oscillospiraceae bacterium]
MKSWNFYDIMKMYFNYNLGGFSMKSGMLMKRLLSALLLVCMLVGLLPANVLAQTSAVEVSEAVSKPATKAATSYVSQINSLDTPYNEAISPTTNRYTTVFANNGLGYYYIVNKASATAGHLLSMSEQNYDQYIPSTDVTISGSSLTNPDPNNAVKIKATATWRGVLYPYKGNTLTLLREEGNEAYLRTERGLLGDSMMGGRVSNGLWVFPIFNTGATATDSDPWFTLTYDASEDAFAYVYHGLDHESFLSTQTMQLYRVYTQGIELYKAIKTVQGYADGNADGRFPDDLYTTFSNYLASCISTYETNNIATDDEEALKTELDQMATNLINYANDLSENVTNRDSYIDIPIEIMDFRADGMLLEWERGNYGKWNFRSDTAQTGAEPAKTTLGSKATVYTGLTESKLVKGQMVYTPKMVAYVAGFLSENYAMDWSTNTKIPGYNSIPYAKMEELTEMGDFDKTIAKTTTGANGGYLKWSQVTTYFDMAYYILNNLWRPVESDDYMDTTKQLGYNMLVPERKRLRLFLDEETGLYTIDSANRMVYDGYYVFNASETYPSDAMYNDAYFRPIDNLGFETEANMTLAGGDTDQGEYLTKYQHESEDMNFHFSMHAEGSFVYYHDQNLYFEFVGDDDVYFYINGQIALDLGGSHGATGDRLYLNTIAEKFGLEDEGVYSFDMFYIERHTTASNLKFSTNIKIVETETMTTKGMYAETSNGISKINSTTGMGEALVENALVRDGDTIAYSFNIANSRDIPVYNVSFEDKTLGASLSKDAVTLCNTSLTGGASTSIEDIEFYYRTIDDDGVPYAGNPSTKTVAEIKALINAANGAGMSLNYGAYRVTMTSVDDIQALLALGIPMKCQLCVYGFKRTAQEELPNYKNTVTSLCYYNLAGTAQTTAGVEEISVSGSASRSYQVTAAPPTVDAVELVLDYGKQVEIPISTIQSNIKTDSLTTITSLAGIVTSGSHEDVLTHVSSSKLLCASDGATYAGKNGTFIRNGNTLVYQPTKFMDSIETVYLVYNMNATNSEYKYMLVELKLVPATSVYYETDFADGAISAVDGADMFDDTNSFYVDFNNTELDQKRYENTVYGGKNYDLASSWGTLTSQYSAPVVDHKAGTLTTSYVGTRTWIWVQAHQDLDTGFGMNYHPIENSHVIQVRVKFSNMAVTSGGIPYIRPYYFTAEDRFGGAGSGSEVIYQLNGYEFDAEKVTGGKWVTLTFPVKGLDSKEHTTLSNMRFQFGCIQSASSSVNGSVTIDYIYVGPANNAPAQDHLYFDFGNTDADRNRYSTHGYRSVNYDLDDNWVGAWLESGIYAKAEIDHEAGTLTTVADANYNHTGCYVETTKFGYIRTESLKFDPTNAEVMQIRFKMSSASATAPKLQLGYGVSENISSTKYESTKQQFTYTTAGEYITETVSLSNTVRNAGLLANIRPQFVDIGAGTEVTIDYIYIGPAADAPAKDYLYCDFGNRPIDQDRYGDSIYAGKNYDLASNWGALTKLDGNAIYTEPVVDNEAGTMSVSYAGTRTWIWAQMNKDLDSGFTLEYHPQSTHIVQMRVKFSDMAVVSGKTPYAQICYFTGPDRWEGNEAIYGDGDEELLYKMDAYSFDASLVTSNDYVTITFPVAGLDSTAHTTLSNLRFQIGNIQSASSSVHGSVTFDYIYIGPENGIDDVRAKNKALQDWQSVSEGDSGAESQDVIDFESTKTYEPKNVLESIGAGTAQRNEYYGIRNGLSNYNNNIPLSFSHRGSFRTSSENSYIAVLDSLKLGMDGVEIDLQITSDGVMILCHNDTITGMTNAQSGVKVNTLAWSAIQDYPLEVGNGASDPLYYTISAEEAALLNTMSNYTAHYGEAATEGGNHYLARLDDLLELLYEQAPNAIITLDKMNTQAKFVATYKLLKEKYDGKFLNQAMFKISRTVGTVSTINTWTNAAATECGISQAAVKSSFMMLYVVGTSATVTELQEHLDNGSYIKAVEYTYGASADAKAEKHLTTEYLPFVKSKGIDFYPSTIGPDWAGGRDDDETTWLYYLQMGADGIMTDRPEEFAAFMHYYNGASRATTERIEAEVFQNYNTDSARFYMSEAADLSNNKLVNKMYNGDWLEYRNITFSGTEASFYVEAKGFAGGVLEFYVDSLDAKNCFATATVPVSDFCHRITASIFKTVSAGNHTVYVKAVGENDEALLSFDAFSCEDQTNENYLFFDFTNTEADQARYSQQRYGGGAYNFDTKEYWSTYATDSGGSNTYKDFSIDTTNGVAVVHVSQDITDSSVYGPKFMTTTTYGTFPWTGRGDYAPLKYTPTAADFVAVRFRLDGVTDTGDNYIIMEYHYDDASGTDHIQYERYDKKNFANYTFVTGEYQTVYIPTTYTYSEASYITSFGLRFCGIKGDGSSDYGTVTIDYIYAGPMQLSNSMLIDFDENPDSYYDPVYGGKNYDLESAWSHKSSRSTAPTIENGIMSFTIIDGCDTDYHRMTTASSTMKFVPGDDDYCQIRFRMTNAVGTVNKTPAVHLYFSPDLYNRTDYLINHGIRGPGNSNSSSGSFNVTNANAGWQVLSFHMSSLYYRDASVIGALCLMFNKIDPSSLATFEIDYIYVGPLEEAPDRQSENDSLFFDFTDTAADRERYTDESYGSVNYDEAGGPYWFDRLQTSYNCAAAQTAIVDNNEGTLVLTQQESQSAIWTETSRPTLTGVGKSVSFDTAKAEVYQIRFKLENFVANGTNTPYVNFHPWLDGTAPESNAKAPYSFSAAALNSGEYMTVTLPVPDAVASFSRITNLRVYFGNLCSESTSPGVLTIDYIYVGTEEGLPTKADTYGYDSSYTTDSKLSYGSSMFVEGKGIPLMYSDKSINYAGTSAYTEISFDFTGTGFDLISRTGAKQGLLRAVIYDADGKFVKVASVINKGTSELYQIPVMSIEKLPHGTYTAKVFVSAAYDYGNDGNADSFGGSLDRGGEFYFDAIRIYNPIDTTASTADAQEAYDIYQAHGEADPVYTEVRNMLITAESFTVNDTMEGVVYLDTSGDTVSLAKYQETGPNNELYLSAGRAIAFELEVTGTIPASIDIGAKSITGEDTTLAVRVAASAPTALPTASDITSTSGISSSTQQYYPVTILPSQWTTASSVSSVYITIYNNGGAGILSVTDIKYAFDSPNPSKESGKTVRFLVEPTMLEKMNVCYEHTYSYAERGDEHVATCTICAYSLVEAHTFESGVCICGAAESTGPEYELKEDLAFTTSISAGAEMTVSYNIMGAAVNSYKDFYLEVTKDVAGGDPITTVYGITEDREAMTVKNDPTTGEALMYQVTYTGINAKEMGDNFSTTLYAVGEDGTIYYGTTVVDSIKSYLVGKIDDSASIAELKTMAVDMLKYGAAAQVRLGYNTDNLVTADLTEEQLSYATTEIPDAVNNAASSGTGAAVNTNITVTSRVQL